MIQPKDLDNPPDADPNATREAMEMQYVFEALNPLPAEWRERLNRGLTNREWDTLVALARREHDRRAKRAGELSVAGRRTAEKRWKPDLTKQSVRDLYRGLRAKHPDATRTAIQLLVGRAIHRDARTVRRYLAP